MDSNKMGAFIAQVRKERGLTQLELAQKINVTDKAVSKWERGVGFPDIKIIEALAEALGVSVSELMNGERMENAVRDSESDNISNDDILTENKKYAGKIVNFRTYIIVLAAVVLSLSIFLLDSGGFDGAFFVYIPFIMEKSPIQRGTDSGDNYLAHSGFFYCLSDSGSYAWIGTGAGIINLYA